MEIRKFWGHRNSVTGLAASSNGNYFISCGDDRSLRFWDIRASNAVRCIIAGNIDEITTLSFGASDDEIYMATSSMLFKFDLKSSSDVIIRVPTFSSNLIKSEGVAINSMKLCRESGEYLAFADDLGDLTVFDCSSKVPKRKWVTAHNNISSCVEFTSKLPGRIVSGGFDCCVKIWDQNLDNCIAAIDFNTHTLNESETFFNPPFVHDICVLNDTSADSEYLICALGDGSLALLELDTFQILERYSEFHRGMATNLHSYNFMGTPGFITAGIDGNIHICKLDPNKLLHIEKNWISSPTTRKTEQRTHNNGKKSKSVKSVTRKKQGSHTNHPAESVMINANATTINPIQKFKTIHHNSKVNAIASLGQVESTTTSSALHTGLVVADISKDITLYDLCG